MATGGRREMGRGRSGDALLAALAMTALGVVGGAGTVVGAQTPDQVERGVKVYADQRCNLCHSVGEEGNRRGPLDDVGERLTAEEIRAWIVDAPGMTAKTNADRKPPMRAYTNLPEADLEALVAYMLSLKP